jgi:predicted MPP superfamily phosphohydrolase
MKLVKRIGLGFVFIVVVMVVWGLIEPYFIDSKEETAELPGLPVAWEGQKVALLTDFQIGMWLDNTLTVKHVIEQIIDVKPALVLIAGDFIYHPLGAESTSETREEIEQEDIREVDSEIFAVVELLQPLLATNIPIYAVLGNHDYGMQTPEAIKLEWLAQEVQEKLETAGVQVLENEAVALSLRGEDIETAPLYVVGIGSHYAGKDKPIMALEQVPKGAARLVFMHHPKSFLNFLPGSAPVALAGHTHGGQLRIPYTGHWSWMALFEKDPLHADGWVEDYGQAGNRLYINRGIGFSVIPLRINAKPELTWLTLKRAITP